MTYIVQDPSDWQKVLVNRGLTSVIDPMVLRCGELFLRGSTGVPQPEVIWEFLSKNIGALGMFIDSVVLNENIPAFNYGDTYDMGLNLDQHVFAKLNENGEVICDVNVDYLPYHQVKTAAIAELKKVYKERGLVELPSELTRDILAELSAAEYQWNPYLEDLDVVITSSEDKKLASFILGALIFQGYAQIMEGEHLVQPKRSRMLIALGLRGESMDAQDEDKLFALLKARASSAVSELPWRPTLFPYLLSKADTPQQLIQQALNLRKSSMVKNYRKWLKEAKDDLKNDGRIRTETANELRAVRQMVDRELGDTTVLPQVEMKVTVADVVAPKAPGGIDFTPTLHALWGWFLATLPGNNYRKLLTRAIVADHEYVRLENRIRTVWKTC